MHDYSGWFWYFYYKRKAEREEQEKIRRGEILEA